MALKPCRECGKTVSSEAATCPHCGIKTPVKRGLSAAGIGCITLVVVLFIVAIANGVGDQNTPLSPAQREARDGENTGWAARAAVRQLLKDPSSAHFSKVIVYKSSLVKGNKDSTLVACGQVNAKNSFGGYTGMTDFVSNGSATGTFIEGIDEGRSFTEIERRACSGRYIAEVDGE